jgi:hypothetical protein
MADDADRAQLEIESELSRARLAAQARFRLIPSGHCHNCHEQLGRAGQLFCDRECAQDFEKRERGLALRGD